MNELNRLKFSRKIVNRLPLRTRRRFAKMFYNYESEKVKGIDIIENYLAHPKLKILINTKEFSGWNIFFFGYYEKDTNNILNEYIGKDDIVIEAGAHNGTESLIVGNIISKGNGKLYAFEPIPSIFKKLKQNISLNNFENFILPIQLALGESNKEITFFLMPQDAPNQGMSSKYQYAEAEKSINVEQVSLDYWLEVNKIPHIDFIKMDIQGSEIDLMKGGINSIKTHKPIILTEAGKEELEMGGNSLKIFWDLLNEIDYNIYNINNNRKLVTEENLVPGIWLAINRKNNKTTKSLE